MEIAKLILKIINTFFVIYLIGYATFLLISVVIGSIDLYKKRKNHRIKEKIKNDYEIPISIIIPAYNEEITSVDTIKSLIDLDYKNYEIIIVDDGSTDETSNNIIKAFDMHKVNRPIDYKVKCKRKKAVYESNNQNVQITLVIKENGGKADSLNMGINIAKKDYFICMDADSLLQYDSLKKISEVVLEDDKVIACGGLIRISNGVKIKKGRITRYGLPKKILPAMQALEYGRSFFASRIMLDKFNGNLIISGAFGLFKTEIVKEVGGYDNTTVGEDMELVMRLHVYCKKNNIPYSIKYQSDAICWSQVPEKLKDLKKQRGRWHIGLLQSMMKYKEIFLNSKYGLISFISFIYFLLYELLSPLIELIGVITMIVSYFLNLINLQFMILFFVLYASFGAILSLTVFLARVYIEENKIKIGEFLKAIFLCLIEFICIRPVIAWTRLMAMLNYKTKKMQWGKITRIKQYIND